MNGEWACMYAFMYVSMLHAWMDAWKFYSTINALIYERYVRICVYIYIYAFMCVCVCVCVCARNYQFVDSSVNQPRYYSECMYSE